MVEIVGHSQTKGRDNREPKRRPKPARQSSTLPMSGERKRNDGACPKSPRRSSTLPLKPSRREGRRWIQSVVATPTPIFFTEASNSSSASAGVFHPSVFLGRPLSAAATADISSAS